MEGEKKKKKKKKKSCPVSWHILIKADMS